LRPRTVICWSVVERIGCGCRPVVRRWPIVRIDTAYRTVSLVFSGLFRW
jgi:hypothetical protein